MNGVIYKITSPTNKIYIGQSIDIINCAEDNNFKYAWFKKVLVNKIKNKTPFKYKEIL